MTSEMGITGPQCIGNENIITRKCLDRLEMWTVMILLESVLQIATQIQLRYCRGINEWNGVAGMTIGERVQGQ
jgi:hypothetical protein